MVGSRGSLITNNIPNVKWCVRRPVTETVIRAIGPYLWDDQFDHDGLVKNGVSLRVIKIDPEGSGIL